MDLNAYALWLLSAREYSVARLREKCTEKYPEHLEEIELLINNFVQKKYLDDERFCEVMIRSEIRKGNGKQKIVQKLMQKGIDLGLAKEQVEVHIQTDDLFDAAWTLAEKKKLQIERKYPETSDFEKQQKLMQYLAGRGYDYDFIKQLV